GVYIDSITIYPATASASYTVVVQNSSSTVIASSSGTTTVGGNQAERIKVNLFIPVGTGYRLGLATSSVGMLRNSTGASYPYTVPGVMTFTGATFGTTYWYFFYNIRIHLPSFPTDAGISAIISPGDTICSGSQPVSVMLKNYGPSTMTSTNINWKINSVVQPLYNWTGSLTSGDSTNVNIGNYNFLTNTTYNILAYTSLPNGVADTVTSNDSLAKSNIIVKQTPTAIPVSTALNICSGDSVLISGSLTGSTPWNIIVSDGTNSYSLNNITQPVFGMYVSPVVTTTYTLTSVSDTSGCVNTSTPSIVVTVIPLPPAVITPQSPTTFCEGDSVILQTITGTGLTYQWEKDANPLSGSTSTYVAYQTGAYTVNITNADGCDSTSAAVNVTVNPLPVINLGNDTIIGVNQTLTLDAGPGFTSYLWSTGDTTQTIIADSAGIGIGAGSFSVTVTDANACEGTDSIQITFVTNPGIEEDQSAVIFNVFPNPARDKINIQFSNLNLPVDLVIFNPLGMKVFEWKCKDNVEINTSNWPRGVYFLMLSNNKMTAIKNVIIN
ncbi:T9SS type A sorting domain-containing protein, partial [Bacteroidota bacterium]